jgi:L-asparaginase/Glu-tRNA(Gln) amidotransferase subunit D
MNNKKKEKQECKISIVCVGGTYAGRVKKGKRELYRSSAMKKIHIIFILL